MKFSNAMQMKAYMKMEANKLSVPSAALLQNYMLERLLERISLSKYSKNFVLKGGMLISAIVGLDSRSTMDMDTTLRNLPLSEELLLKAFEEIFLIYIDDGIAFKFTKIEPIREDDVYGGFRVSLIARYETISAPLKIDITTGDAITPREINFTYQLMFQENEISVLAYPIETILAEKYETIIRRSLLNTRIRDFYDLHVLYKLKSEQINIQTLRQAITMTAIKRKSLDLLLQYEQVIQSISIDPQLERLWKVYQKEYVYAAEISFADLIETLHEFSSSIGILSLPE